jgi:polyphosphate kinase 2 (PPK2 family)
MKLILHEREEQAPTLVAKIEEEEHHWKFSPGFERANTDEYMHIIREAIETATRKCAWYIIL